jgi:hypothetical protein
MEKEPTEYQGWQKWEDKFKPIHNHFSNDPDQNMFETYGEEVEFVTKADNKYVWTWIQGDMSDLIVAGYHYVNRLGCECYNEEGYEDGEMGKSDCLECEGYGLVTKYVD